jgi:signal transduction histidine kinase
MGRDIPPGGRRPVGAVVAGLAGGTLLAVAASPKFATTAVGVADARPGGYGGGGLRLDSVPFLLIPVVATLFGLVFARRWSYLLLAGGLLGLLGLGTELWPNSFHLPVTLSAGARAAAPLLLIGVLACGQALARAGSTGWGALVVGCAFGAQVLGAAWIGNGWVSHEPIAQWHVGLTVAGLAGVVAGVCRYPRWDSAAAYPDDPGRGWRRWRYPVVGVLAAGIPLLVTTFSLASMARLLGVTFSALYRHGFVVAGIIGVVIVGIAVVLAAAAGVWPLAGALATATVQVGLTAPMVLAVWALAYQGTTRWVAALAGVVAGAAAAASRWRVPLAGGAGVLAGLSLFVAYAATTGDPAKLAEQHEVVPAVLLLVVLAAAGTAMIGATAPVLAARGAVPLVLGPIVAALAVGGRQVLQVTYVGSDGLPESTYLNPVHHLVTSGVLLLAAAAAVGGLALAEVLVRRRNDRKLTEAVRREAAEAERNRLARPIHDGVLQVLALMRRHGPEFGGRGAELAELAGAQEVALRALIRSGPGPVGRKAAVDLRTLLAPLATPAVEVSAPADPVVLPAQVAGEIHGAVAAALDNVRQHAGPRAHAWILVEQESGGVRVTVRDNGPGLAPGRLDEAAAAGRLGVAQSMRGRIADLGGDTVITSRPGQGTEVEFWIPGG